MPRRNLTIIAAAVIATVGAGLLAGSSSSAGPQPEPSVARPVPDGTITDEAIRAAEARHTSPVVATVEVTKPGDGTDYAIFHNGKVHKVRAATRTFIVTHADGTTGTRIEEDGSGIARQLPPHDARFDNATPSPEQVAEMGRAVGVQPGGPPGP